MHNVTTSRHIRAATELCIIVPLKRQFVPITELVMSHATRVSTVLKALAELRQAKMERGLGNPFGPIEVLHTIHRVQWTVLEPFDDTRQLDGRVTRQLSAPQIMLTSHFDRSWEDYFCALVDVGGPLLDLIFSHCEGYDGSSCKDGYEPFSAFIRRHQRPVNFLYAGSPELTVDDVRYLARLPGELARQAGGALGPILATVEADAAADSTPEHAQTDRTRSALRGVHVLYDIGQRLFSDAVGLSARGRSFTDRELYEDAIRSVLKIEPDLQKLLSLEQLVTQAPPRNDLVETSRWVHAIMSRPDLAKRPIEGLLPAAADAAPEQGALEALQGNVLTGYAPSERGALCLFQCADAAGLRQLLARARPLVTTEAASLDPATAQDARVNLGVTYAGFKLLQLPQRVLETLPREFREGAEERAGMLGDVAFNHPANWRWPLRKDGKGRLHPSTFHVALSVLGSAAALEQVKKQLGDCDAWQLVHELPLSPSGEPERSQPLSEAQNARRNPRAPKLDEQRLGEFFLGYKDRLERSATSADAQRNPDSAKLFHGSTFMAMRKMHKDDVALDAYIDKVAAQIRALPGAGVSDAQLGTLREEVRALIIGRKTDGSLLGALQPAADKDPNDFDYTQDPRGELCPLHAHTRRSNPRTGPHQTPRIVRRGVPYDAKALGPDAAERGLLFMAYCANLAEQYELVQRWVNGGNSTGLPSRQNDLLCGAPLDDDAPRMVSLRGTCARNAEQPVFPLPKRETPFTTLRWALYLFIPSLPALEWLIEDSLQLSADTSMAVARGRARIAELEALPVAARMYEWKRLLEEVPEAGCAQALHAADVSAAISQAGGALRVEGDAAHETLVVVTTEKLARKVLADDKLFSVSGYRDRLRRAVQDHYLGYDHDTKEPATGLSYTQLSAAANTELEKLKHRAFDDARDKARALLRAPGEIQLDPDGVGSDGSQRHSISVHDLARAAIAQLCHDWLDMPGVDKQADTLHLMKSLDRFLVASRYCFQAQPVPYLEQVAQQNQAQIARDYAGLRFESEVANALTLESFQRAGKDKPLVAARKSKLKKVGAQQSLRSQRRRPPTPPETARAAPDLDALRRMAVIGAVGFAPPAVGAITRILDHWIESEQLWQLQRLVEQGADRGTLLPAIYAALGKAPAPPTLYRTARQECRLGKVSVPEQARVIVQLGAVYADACEQGSDAPEAWFYGGKHRGPQNPRDPRHGCPAREAGGYVMAGIIHALLEQRGLKREHRLVLSYEVPSRTSSSRAPA